MRAFIINLDRAPERLARMEKIMEGLGATFSRVAATDGKQISQDQIAQWRGSAASADAALAGETACFLSHRGCWRRVVDEALPYAAIFEDDLHFASDARALLTSDDWVPADTDIVKIETKLYPTGIDKSPTGGIGTRRLFRLRGKHAGAGGYIVSRKGAETLLRMSETFDDPVDQFIFNPSLPSGASLVIYQLVPAVCIQDFVMKDRRAVLGLGSDLHEQRQWERPRGLAKLWREVKRPGKQVADVAGRALSNLFAQQRWISVPFE